MESATNPLTEGSSPRNQLYVQTSWDLTPTLELDVAWRYTDELSAQLVPAYNAMDIRLAWTPCDNFEWAVVGRNLLDQQRFEFGSDPFLGTIATEVEREVYTMVTIRR